MNHKRFYKTISVLMRSGLLVVLLFSCGGDNERKILPFSIGRNGEVLVVCDDAFWKGTGGDSLRSVLEAPYGVLPRYEPMFTIRRIPSSSFQWLLRRYSKVVFAGAGSPESARAAEELLRGKTSSRTAGRSFAAYRDVWATPQMVFAFSDSEFSENLRALAAAIRNYENENILSAVHALEPNRKAMKEISGNFGLSIHIPFVYRIEAHDSGFVWLMHNDRSWKGGEWHEVKTGIVIYSTPVVNSLSVPVMTARRDRELGKRIVSDRQQSYMITDTVLPVQMRRLRINGREIAEMRGLWRMAGDFMGGPFLNYTFPDSEGRRLITLEGFVYSPGTEKRNLMRRLEVMLAGFKEIKNM